MARWRRTTRIWLAATGTVWVPVFIAVSGLTGFWPVMGVCAAGALWTCWLFRSDLARITIDVAPDERHQRPIWLILPSLALFLFAAYPFVYLYQQSREYVEPLGFEDVLQSYLHDRSIYISDLARTETVVHDKVFERIHFIGPAIIAMAGGDTWSDNYLNAGGGDFGAVLLEVPENQQSVGAIVFRDCVFKHCHFDRIQIAGPKDLIDKIRANTISINGIPVNNVQPPNVNP